MAFPILVGGRTGVCPTCASACSSSCHVNEDEVNMDIREGKSTTSLRLGR